MRSAILLSIASLAGVCLVSAGSGCGSSNSSSPPGNDSGADSSSSSGGSSGGSSGSGSGGLPGGDASNDTGGDGAMPCTLMPTGTQVLATTTQSVFGVTSDNQVLLYDWNGLTLSAAPLAMGSKATMIGPFNNTQDFIGLSGAAVVLVQGATSAKPYGKLTVWTAANGAKQVGTATLAGTPGSGALDVSSDGKYVLYTDNATATTADIYVANIDGTGATKLNGNTPVSVGATCAPVLHFAGDDAVVSYCTAQPDASTADVAQILAYSGPPSWNMSQNVTMGTSAAANFVAVHTGTSSSLVAFTTSAGLQVEAIPGSTATVIDAKGQNGFFNNAGTSFVYFDKTGNIWTSSVTTPAPAELVVGPVFGTLSLSADDSWLEFAKNQDSNTGLTDMFVVSTTASGADGGNAVTTLDSMTDGANFGDAFTADSKYAAFYKTVNSSGTGNLMSQGLPPSAAAKSVSTTAWVGYGTGNSKLVYSDNWSMVTGSFQGYADIHSLDLSGTAAPSPVVTSADSNFFVTTDKSKIIFSWHACPGAAEGVYSIATP